MYERSVKWFCRIQIYLENNAYLAIQGKVEVQQIIKLLLGSARRLVYVFVSFWVASVFRMYIIY